MAQADPREFETNDPPRRRRRRRQETLNENDFKYDESFGNNIYDFYFNDKKPQDDNKNNNFDTNNDRFNYTYANYNSSSSFGSKDTTPDVTGKNEKRPEVKDETTGTDEVKGNNDKVVSDDELNDESFNLLEENEIIARVINILKKVDKDVHDTADMLREMLGYSCEMAHVTHGILAHYLDGKTSKSSFKKVVKANIAQCGGVENFHFNKFSAS